MALTFTAGTSVESTASVTSTTVTLPAQVDGDYAVIAVSCNVANATAITVPTGWTSVVAPTDSVNGSTSDHFAVFYRKWISGDPSTVAITTASGRVAATPFKVSGADPTNFVDVAGTVTQAASGATTLTAPSITPASTWLVCGFNGRNSASTGVYLTPWSGLTAGMTEIAEASSKSTSAANAGHMLAFQQVTAGAATGTRSANPANATTGAMAASFSINEAVSAPAYSDSVTLSGAGTLTAAATPHLSAAVTLSGAGTLTAAGVPHLSASVGLSGAGTLSAAGVEGHSGTVSLSGDGTLSGSGSGGSDTASLDGAGTLTVNPGALSIQGGVALSGDGNLTLAADAHLGGTAALTGAGTLTAAGHPNEDSTVTLTGVGALSVTVVQSYAATVNLGGIGTLLTTAPVYLPPPQTMLIDTLSVMPVERMQRNGATAAQIAGFTSLWNGKDETWRAQMGEAIAQNTDAWVQQQIAANFTNPIPGDVQSQWPYGGATLPATPRTNLALNPRLGIGDDGWGRRWFGGGGGAGSYSWVSPASGDAPIPGGGYSRKKWTAACTGNGDTGFEIMATGNATGTPANYFSCTPGEQITISGWMRASSAGKTFQAGIYWFPPGSNTLLARGHGANQAQIGPGVWQRVFYTFTAPAGAGLFYAIMDVSGITGETVWQPGDTLDNTGLLIERTATVDTYFDGSTPNDLKYRYQWGGGADASASYALS